MGEGKLPREERLRRSDEFQALFRRGRRVERPSVLLFWSEGGVARKVGFAVGRQVQGAVSRNRARRRLREAYRRARGSLPPGVQLVLVAREAFLTGSFERAVKELREAMETIARRRAAQT